MLMFGISMLPLTSLSQMPISVQSAIQQCIDFANERKGATGTNPTVGAVAWDNQGQILEISRHQGTGHEHAEALLIHTLKSRGLLPVVDGLFITLEPCNHTGKTGPCTRAIIESGIKNIFVGWLDPNPQVKGGGLKFLQNNGLKAVNLALSECKDLILPFFKWSTTGLPWITLKKALRQTSPKDSVTKIISSNSDNSLSQLSSDYSPNGSPAYSSTYSMIPPPGKKVFTQPNSLKLSHSLRKQSNAILTGSGTVLADSPEFTVREVPEHHPQRTQKQILLVLDRTGRIKKQNPHWVHSRERAGFEVFLQDFSLSDAFKFLGSKGCHEVLVEAGPTLTASLEKDEFWDKRITILHHPQKAISDEILLEIHPRWKVTE